MENFDLKEKEKIYQERYCEDDEIDFTELLKTIIKERKIVMIITAVFTAAALCFGVYRENRPKEYTASVVLNNRVYNILLDQEIIFNEENRENIFAYIEKINVLVKNEKINEFIVSNDIIKLKENNSFKRKDKENGSILFLEFFYELNNFTVKEFLFSSSTKNKDLTKAENEIKNKINILNEEINIIFKENLNTEIQKTEKQFENLKNEAFIINEQVKKLINENKIIITDKTAENFALAEPVLYIKFNENREKLQEIYHNMQNLIMLEKMSREEEILKLEYKDIRFNESRINLLLIAAAGIFLGLCAGIFTAVAKDSVKKLLEEIKN